MKQSNNDIVSEILAAIEAEITAVVQLEKRDSFRMHSTITIPIDNACKVRV